MPKIEVGSSSGIFLINGRPYTSGQYQINTSDDNLASTTANIDIVGIHKDNRASISEGNLSTWTNAADAPFATLQAFFTYCEGFALVAGSGGGGGAVDSFNGRTGAVVPVSGDYTNEQVGVSDEVLAGADVTGVLTGCEVTINADPTKYNVAAGTLVIIDWTTPGAPLRTPVTFLGATAVIPPDASLLFTQNAIDVNGDLVHAGVALNESGEFFTNEQKRAVAVIQTAITNDGVNVSVGNSSRPAYEVTTDLIDYVQTIGALNTDNQYTDSTSTTIQKEAGTSTGLFINRSTNPQNPTPRANVSIPTVSVFGNFQDGSGGFTVQLPVSDLSTSLDLFDDGSGVLATMTNNNKYQVKRLSFFGTNDVTSMTYGQVEYNSLQAARLAILSENPNVNPQLSQSVFLTALVHKKGADLTDPAEALFVPISGQSLGTAIATHSEDFILGVLDPSVGNIIGYKVSQVGGTLASVVVSATGGTSIEVTANYSATSGGAKTEIATGTATSGTDLTMSFTTDIVPAGSFVSFDVDTVTGSVLLVSLNFLF